MSLSALLALAATSCSTGAQQLASQDLTAPTAAATTYTPTTDAPTPTATQTPVAPTFQPVSDPSRASRSYVRVAPKRALPKVTCWNGKVVTEHPDRQDCPDRPKPKVKAHPAVKAEVKAPHHVITVPSSRRAMWDRLVACEAPDRGWRYGAPGVGIDAGYYFEGGPNFTHGTWAAYGGLAFAQHAWNASVDEQIIVAERVLHAQGVHAWPVCGPKTGLHL